MKEVSKKETVKRKVWDVIKDRKGEAAAVNVSKLAARCRVSEREIRSAVYDLTLDGRPICSLRSGKYSGYYIPANAREVRDSLEQFEKQLISCAVRIARMKKCTVQAVCEQLVMNLKNEVSEAA